MKLVKIIYPVDKSEDGIQEETFSVEEVFEELQKRGIKIALNTGFTKVITDAIVNKLGWKTNPLINAVISSDEVQDGRPHSDMIKKIMAQ